MADEGRESSGLRLGLGPGTQLNGIYEIEHLIGVGGMGEVYKGRAIQTGDAVAIKTIRPDLAENQAALTLFRKEAAALHNLYHEAIVRYYVFSVDPQIGSPYLAMEYVDGEALSDVLKRGALGYEAVRILQRRLADGLQAAHERGIIHRDISPDNVILPSGRVERAKIIDFGIARSTILGEGTVVGGGVAGKFGYMSPEQLGLFGGDVTPKSDIYSLGLVLAEALGGRAIDMRGSHVEVIEKRRKVPDLSSLDNRLRPLLERMLQPDPAQRIGTMADVAAWQPAKAGGTATRRKWPLIAAGLAGVGVLGAVAAFVVLPELQSPSGPRPTNPPEFPVDPVPPPGPQGPSRPQNQPPTPTNQDPTLPPSQPPRTRPRAEDYVRSYEGGDCFYLHPLNVTSASVLVEGFGSSPSPFAAFDEDFKKVFGFEPNISLRQVNDSQCASVAFMKAVGIDVARGPKLQIDAFNLKAGETLSGSVEGYGSRHIDVILVADDGYVHVLSEYLKREGQNATFRLKPERTSGAQRSRPQLVIAVASPQPLALLSTGKPISGDTLFPLLADEIRRLGSTVDIAVKYFRLE